MHKILWEDASRRCGDDHVTKSRNRKLVRVNERLKHKCIDLSDYNRYLNQIWYEAQNRTITRSEWYVKFT